MTTITVEQCDELAAAELLAALDKWPGSHSHITAQAFAAHRLAAIERAVAEERERCAKVAEIYPETGEECFRACRQEIGCTIASAIRSGDSLHGEGAT